MKSLRTVFVAMAAMTMMMLPMRAWADTPVLPDGVQAWDGTTATNWTGSGSESDPIVIMTAEQLAGLADSVNKGYTFEGKHIVLGADLYLSDPSAPDEDKHEWMPIGAFMTEGEDWDYTIERAYFHGHFNGQNHTIYYLYHGSVSENDIWGENRDPWDIDPGLDFTGWHKALFGYVNNATIENLTLAGVSMVGMDVAGLILEAQGNTIVRHCHVSGNVVDPTDYKTGGGGAAGLVLILEKGGLIEHCTSSVNAYGARGVGSLVGNNYGTIRDCHATGNAHCTEYNVGGLVGANSGLIERCYATGNVSRSYFSYAQTNGTPDCGGFVGVNWDSATIRECYATGEVNSRVSGAGFCGTNYGHIESCFSTGNVIASTFWPVIFCSKNGRNGSLYDEELGGTIINCFGVGASIRSDDEEQRPGYGFMQASNGRLVRVVNCSYNLSACKGFNVYSAGGSKGYTEAQMKSQAFVDTLNFFAAICGTSLWEYRPGDYPIPTGQKASGELPYLAGGDGSREHPWQISNLEQLKNFRTYVNGGWDFRNQYIELTADIDMNLPYEQWEEVMPENWGSIGKPIEIIDYDGHSGSHTYEFRGDFNGNFHTINNLYVNNLKYDQGLFYELNKGAHTHNLGMVDVHISTKSDAGAIAASTDYGDVRLTQCWSSGEITASYNAGGLLGSSSRGIDVIKNCYSSARLQTNTTGNNTGTIFGSASGDTLANCLYYGSVTKSVFPNYAYRYNCFYDYDTLPNSGEYRTYGRSKEEMQSVDFVNRLNYYVDRSNTYDTVQLNYWMHRPGDYPAFTQEQPPFRITFISNGGSPVVTQSVWPNSHAVRPDAPTLEGNTFVGWYADEALTQVFEFDSVLVNENKTLYAKWISTDMEPDYSIFQNEFAKTFIICTPAQLYGFACAVNGIDGVLEASTFEGKTVKLGNDILMQDTTGWQHWGKDLAAKNFTSIGTKDNKFKGTFDGQGYTISGLYISPKTIDYVNYGGLFYSLAQGSTVQNLSLRASVVYGPFNKAVGLLAGELNGVVDNCHVTGHVYNSNSEYDYEYSNTGGMIGGVGSDKTWISNCTAHTRVEGYGRVGGFIGYIGSGDTIQNCEVTANVLLKGFMLPALNQKSGSAGGFIGNDNGGYVKDCLVRGEVRSRNYNTNTRVGGFLGSSGSSYGTFTRCKAYASVSGYDNVGGFASSGQTFSSCRFEGKVQGHDKVAGFVVNPSSVSYSYSKAEVTGHDHVCGFSFGQSSGSNYSNLIRSFAEGDVRGNEYVFGFVEKYSNITNCYSRVNVTGSDYVSGFANNSVTLSNVYMAGQLSCGGEHVGGLYLGNSTNTTVYYDKELSGLSDIVAIQARTTSEMKDAATYAGWDFEKTWGIRDTINNGYPVLISFYPDDFKWIDGVGDFEVEIGKTYQLQPVIKPATGGSYTFLYTSSDETLVTVSETGLVTANPTQAGRCTITIATTDGRVATKRIKCRVLGVDPTGIEIYDEQGKLLPNDTTIKLPYYGSMQLKAKVLPPEADQTVTWSKYNDSYNPMISLEDGLVTHLRALSGATPRVSVYPEGKSSLSARVYIGEYDPTVVTDIKIIEPEAGTITLCNGDSVRFEYEVIPASARDYCTVTFTSSNNTYIAIDQETGWVKAIGRSTRGETSVTITVSIKDNKRIKDTRTVKIPKTCDTYTITAEPNDAAYGSVSGGGVYDEFATATLTAEPNEGYRFVEWNDGNRSNPRTVTVTEDATYTAIFKPVDEPDEEDYYYIAAESDNEDFGYVTGGGGYKAGSTVTLRAVANPGYAFSYWRYFKGEGEGEEEGTSMSNPLTITVTEPAFYMAVFEPVEEYYTITAESGNEDAGYVTGGGEYKEGSTITLRAVANPGYVFRSWMYFDGEEEGESTSNPLTVTVTKDAYYIAVFEPDEEPDPTYYTINVDVNDWEGGYVTGGGEYKEGSTATLRAVSYEGYVFRYWYWNDEEGDERISASNPLTVRVTNDAFYVAVFEPVGGPDEPTYYTVLAEAYNEGGYVTGGGEYEAGSVAVLTAVPYEGYRLSFWYDVEGYQYEENPLVLTVTGDAVYMAVFEPNDGPNPSETYTITTVVNDNAFGYVLGGGEYEAGGTATLTAVANAGYSFSFWSDGEGNQYEENPLVVPVIGDALYMAVFAPDDNPNPSETYTITTGANDNAFGYVLGGGEYEAGSTAVLTAVANPGYEFVQWSDGNKTNPRSVTVTKNATYTAIFAPSSQPSTANEINLWEGLKVYPNPSDGRFVVETGAMPVSASVYGENGTLVYRGQWPALSRQQMDLSGQAGGVYYLRLQAENTVKIVKLIIR